MKHPFSYEVIYSGRKTLAIQITTEGSVKVRAPKNCPRSSIDRFLKEKEACVRIHRSLFSYGMLEGVVEKDNVFIVAVGHQKAAGNGTQPGKAQLFVQVQRPFVAFDHGVKL